MNVKTVLLFNFLFSFIFSFSENYENLYKWLINNGAYISKKIFPKEETIYNRYILTKEKIYQKEELLFIPDKLTISTLNGFVFEQCEKGFEKYYFYASKDEKVSFDYDCLVYYLTIDKENKESFFKNYYNYLPKIQKEDYSLYFNEEDKNFLNKIELDTQIRRQDFFLNKSLRPIKNEVQKIENGLEKFKENFIYVSTRNFGRRGSFYDDTNTLVPFLDLLNHNNNYNAWFYFDEKRDGFVLFAIKDIEKNEEITISYGKFNNIYLYSMYGFTIKDNIYKQSIYLEVDDTKVVLFENIKKDEIMKVFNLFNPKNIKEKNDLFIKIINTLKNKLNVYQRYIQTYQNNMNILNIIEDLKWVVNQYILLCNNLIKSYK